MLKHGCIAIFSAFLLLFSMVSTVSANQTKPVGIHILRPEELKEARELIAVDQNTQDWHYVTIPFTLEDMKDQEKWQGFFDEAKELKVIPLVRLATKFENESWIIPNKKQIVDQITFLGSLEWPTDQKYIIVFNEVNHAKEWGGTLDPAEYARVLEFTSSWARSEQKNFVILPAAMDLAAPNGRETKEAFAFLEAMEKEDPEIFSYIDIWNSHSYPNPAFSAAPTGTAQNSLRGFKHELAFLKEKTDKDFKVMITETGWENNAKTSRWLYSYYQYAVDHVWSDPQVLAVTPFILKGSPGPFSGFSFLDAEGKPTKQYLALKEALKDPSDVTVAAR